MPQNTSLYATALLVARWRMVAMSPATVGARPDGYENPSLCPENRGAKQCIRVDPAKLRSETSTTETQRII